MSYPSSQGRPVKWDTQEEWVKQLAREQGSLADAARVLIDNGRDDLAVEIAANVWRLWILSRDDAGGRQFLGTILEKTGKGSRARALASYGDGLLAFRLGKIGESRKRNEATLRIAKQAMTLKPRPWPILVSAGSTSKRAIVRVHCFTHLKHGSSLAV